MASSNKKAAERAAMAAQMRAEQAKREARRRILTIVGVALVMVLIVGGAIAISVVKKNHDDKKLEQAVAATGSGSYGLVVGPDDAKHHVVIYEDFVCPICGALEKGSESQIAKLAAKGQVQVEYRPFDLLSGNIQNDYPIRAAGAFSIVLKTAGPEVALKFHNLLYQNQPNEDGPYLSNEDLVKYAVQAGAEESQVKSKIESDAGKPWVEAATKKAFATGLQGTPTMIVDGKLLQGTTAADLLSAIQ